MITIDLESSLPLFNQLVMQIKEAVANKLIQPGDALPSIRQLAADLELNAKTVAKAYRLLERDRVIESKGARGSFVRLDAIENLSFDVQAWLLQEVTKDIQKYREAGATDSEIRLAINQTISEMRS